MSQRTDRVARVVQEELAEMFRMIKDPRVSDAGFLTVTSVRVSDDLGQARVFVSLFDGTPEKKKQLQKGLDSAKPFLERELVKRMATKKVPKLVFVLDETGDRVQKVESILAELEIERQRKKPE